MSYVSSDSMMGDGYSPSILNNSHSVVGESVESTPLSIMPTAPVVELPSFNGVSGFTAGSASKANELPGNLLPAN
jgi:hypothetical protein